VTTYRAVQAAAKQRQIQAAARRLFVQRGFEGTTTDALAAAAGVSKQTLYRYYPSKDQLLVAVMRTMTVEPLLGPALLALPPHATRRTLEQRLVALAAAILERALDPEYLDLARLVIGESGRRPELAALFRHAVASAGSAGVQQLLAAAQAQGLLRPDVEPGQAVPLFAGPLLAWVLGSGLLAGGQPPQVPSERALADLVRLFLDGVAAR